MQVVDVAHKLTIGLLASGVDQQVTPFKILFKLFAAFTGNWCWLERRAVYGCSIVQMEM